MWPTGRRPRSMWGGNLATNLLCHNKDPSPAKVRILFNGQVFNLCA